MKICDHDEGNKIFLEMYYYHGDFVFNELTSGDVMHVMASYYDYFMYLDILTSFMFPFSLYHFCFLGRPVYNSLHASHFILLPIFVLLPLLILHMVYVGRDEQEANLISLRMVGLGETRAVVHAPATWLRDICRE